jgi:serine/threonine protein kinase
MVKPVRYRGREYAVIERLRSGRRTWLAVARLGSAGRQCWQAYDPTSRAMRAVHRLPGSRSTVQRLRVLQELNDGNPELPQVLEFHRDGDDVWVVLPWIEGCDLRTYLNNVRQRNMRRISAPEAVRLMRGLAHALAHLHRRKGIIHGDIKPSNLILTNRTRLVLIDYGSAWTVERTTSRTGDERDPPAALNGVSRRLLRFISWCGARLGGGHR